jgi:hypothetical protein
MKNSERNKPCPCGSRKKYKRCCGFAHSNSTQKTPKFSEIPDDIKKLFEKKKIDEDIRKQQQGLGKPIMGYGNDSCENMQ